MSTADNKAVFLSYASQDAEAAKRICESLRAAGVEVWFDQNELVGGDAWDAKIRKQIKECALLIPIISANTQSRTEGYFRLEWRLADQRTHLMAKGRAFLLPVVIDDTRDSEAHVPDSFTEVQWTKLPGGEGAGAFATRVKKLLSGEPGAGNKEPASASHPVPSHSPAPSTGSRRLSRLWWALPILGVGLAALLFLKRGPGEPARATPAPAAVSEARKLANQALQLLEDPNFTRETSWLADELSQRALALDAADAEVWTVAALASINLYTNTYDPSATRREKINSQAARAAQLDSTSVRAALVVARSLDLNYDNPETLRTLRELHQRAPEDQLVMYNLIRAEGEQGNEAAVQGLLQKLRVLPRSGLLPLTLWFVELQLRGEGRFAESEAILDEMLAGSGQYRGAYYEKLHLLMQSWHDLAEVEPHLERIPSRYLAEPAFGSLIANFWLWRNQPEKALQALAKVPQDYFEEYAAREPKAYLAGWAHSLAGRPAAAQAEWRSALALVEERMKSDNRNFILLNQRALLLGLTGQREAAREAWRLRVELGGEQNRPRLITETTVLLAMGESESAITAIERGWAGLNIGSRALVLPVLRYHPALATIRDDPRVQRIITAGVAELRQLREKQRGAPKSADATAAPVDEKSVAVLAFANLSDDKANEYFSDGISEELLNVLAKVPGLKVTARTSSFHFKGKDTSIPEIARQLGVAYVVEGSVRKQGDKVRITAQLIKADGGFHVWSDTFTRDLKDIFAVQDEIAGLIAKNLQLTLRTSGQVRSVNPEAYELMLKGRAVFDRGVPAEYPQGIRFLLDSLAIDPNSAAAWGRLSMGYMLSFAQYVPGGLPRDEILRLARQAADRAIGLDPEQPLGHYASCLIAYLADWEWARADESLQRVLALAPGDAASQGLAASLALTAGQLTRAREAARRAVALDPLNFIPAYQLLKVQWQSGDYVELEKEARRVIAIHPGSPYGHIFLSYSLVLRGRAAEARQVADQVPAASYRLNGLALAGYAEGKLPDADAALEQLKQQFGNTSAYQVAENYAFRKDPDRAFEWLEAAYRDRDAGLTLMTRDPFLENLRGDARWVAFMRKMNLPDGSAK